MKKIMFIVATKVDRPNTDRLVLEQMLWTKIVNKIFEEKFSAKVYKKRCEQNLFTKFINKICEQKLWTKDVKKDKNIIF